METHLRNVKSIICQSMLNRTQLDNVYLVPGIKTKIVSIGSLPDLRYVIVFDNRGCSVLDYANHSRAILFGYRDPL